MKPPEKPPYFLPGTPPGSCPHCGGPMPARTAATSRYDNKTPVCSTCGVAEAMNAAGSLISDTQFAAILLETQHAEKEHRDGEA